MSSFVGTVTLVFDIVKNKWIPVTFVPYNVDGFCSWWKKSIVNTNRYTAIVDAPARRFCAESDMYEIDLADGFELPTMETLEQRIERTRRVLEAMR